METIVLDVAEYALVSLVWETEPVDLSGLVWSCFVRFDWKKSVTHSILRSMCKRGLLQKEGCDITALVTKAQAAKCESEALPIAPNHRNHSKFAEKLLKNSGIRKILNYKKPWFWLALGLIVSTIACIGILTVPYLVNRIAASNPAVKDADESINEQFYVITEDKFDGFDEQLADIVPPANLFSNGSSIVSAEKGLESINFNYTHFGFESDKIYDLFDIVPMDLDYFAKNAATIFSRIDGDYSIQFNITDNSYSTVSSYTACITYRIDPVTNELQEQISMQKNDTINNGNAAVSTYYVEVASGETIAVVNGWG